MEDAQRVKWAVYSTKGIRGIYVSEDDTAALVTAGFWEEELDFDYLYDRMTHAQAAARGRQPHRLHLRLPVAVHLDPALRARGGRGLRDHDRRAHLPALELLPELAGRLGPDLLRHPVEHLGARHGAAARPEPRPAGARDPGLPLGTRAVALGAVDGPLPRGVPPHRRQAHGDRRVVLAPVPAGDRVGAERRHRHPARRRSRRSRSSRSAPSSRASGSSRSSSAWSRCTRSSCRRPTRRASKSNYPRWAKVLGYARARGRRRCSSSATRSSIAHRAASAGSRRRSCSRSAFALYRWHEVIYKKLTELDDRGEQRLAALGRRAADDRALPRSVRSSAGGSRWAT